jgi:hypothetical protein
MASQLGNLIKSFGKTNLTDVVATTGKGGRISDIPQNAIKPGIFSNSTDFTRYTDSLIKSTTSISHPQNAVKSSATSKSLIGNGAIPDDVMNQLMNGATKHPKTGLYMFGDEPLESIIKNGTKSGNWDHVLNLRLPNIKGGGKRAALAANKSILDPISASKASMSKQLENEGILDNLLTISNRASQENVKTALQLKKLVNSISSSNVKHKSKLKTFYKGIAYLLRKSTIIAGVVLGGSSVYHIYKWITDYIDVNSGPFVVHRDENKNLYANRIKSPYPCGYNNKFGTIKHPFDAQIVRGLGLNLGLGFDGRNDAICKDYEMFDKCGGWTTPEKLMQIAGVDYFQDLDPNTHLECRNITVADATKILARETGKTIAEIIAAGAGGLTTGFEKFFLLLASGTFSACLSTLVFFAVKKCINVLYNNNNESKSNSKQSGGGGGPISRNNSKIEHYTLNFINPINLISFFISIVSFYTVFTLSISKLFQDKQDEEIEEIFPPIYNDNITD